MFSVGDCSARGFLSTLGEESLINLLHLNDEYKKFSDLDLFNKRLAASSGTATVMNSVVDSTTTEIKNVPRRLYTAGTSCQVLWA